MNERELKALYERYLNGQTTEKENAIFHKEMANPAKQEFVESLLHDSFENEPAAQELSEEQQERILSNILQTQPQTKTRRLWIRIAAAASIVLALGVGAYLIKFKKDNSNTNQLVSNFGGDIKPGHNQATLTLANGQKIILTKGLNGQLATEHNTTIKANDNNITYNANNENQIAYNTLTTARGEQSPYPLVLADGTKVWLNAESSITFPTAFNGKERIVKITGEAYFEVKHNPAQPFKVQTPTQTIEDIGTTFNVNSYADESATRTTLIEGSIKVNQLILKPGQQTDGEKIKNVSVDNYTAWKENKFDFEGEDIKSIMRQLARWYDIEVTYQGNITNNTFYTVITRNRNISAALKVLQSSGGVHFKIEGRRVTVIE